MKLIQNIIVDAWMYCDGQVGTAIELDEFGEECKKFLKIFDKFKKYDLKKMTNEDLSVLKKALYYAELWQESLVDCHGEDSEKGKNAYKKQMKYVAFRHKIFGKEKIEIFLENSKMIDIQEIRSGNEEEVSKQIKDFFNEK